MTEVTTINHADIKSLIQKHKGRPAIPTERQRSGTGPIAIAWGANEPIDLRVTSWDNFFHVFETQHLAFVYEEKNDHIAYRFLDREGLSSEQVQT